MTVGRAFPSRENGTTNASGGVSRMQSIELFFTSHGGIADVPLRFVKSIAFAASC
jgi:hypothetical protein